MSGENDIKIVEVTEGLGSSEIYFCDDARVAVVLFTGISDIISKERTLFRYGVPLKLADTSCWMNDSVELCFTEDGLVDEDDLDDFRTDLQRQHLFLTASVIEDPCDVSDLLNSDDQLRALEFGCLSDNQKSMLAENPSTSKDILMYLILESRARADVFVKALLNENLKSSDICTMIINNSGNERLVLNLAQRLRERLFKDEWLIQIEEEVEKLC